MPDLKEMLEFPPRLLGKIHLTRGILFKLKKDGNYVVIILYHTNGQAVIDQNNADGEKQSDSVKTSLEIENPKSFVFGYVCVHAIFLL
jgi:hypothetical protein